MDACVAVCCSVLQCVAVCCSVLQCVAVCCSVLQCVHQYHTIIDLVNGCMNAALLMHECCMYQQKAFCLRASSDSFFEVQRLRHINQATRVGEVACNFWIRPCFNSLRTKSKGVFVVLRFVFFCWNRLFLCLYVGNDKKM